MTARKPRAAAAPSVTADLFAEPASAGVGAGACPPSASLLSVHPSSTRPLRARPLSERPPSARPRPRQLWYAVVFPDLAAPQAASVLPRLCLTAQQFTSSVSIEMPDALLLEIRGSVSLFGTLAVLHAAIDAAWNRLGLRAFSAAAPTTLAALWHARAGKPACFDDPTTLAGALAELPIGCTAWDPGWLQTLRSMGVRRMGELLRLPRGGVARRLSPSVIRDLDIALARQAAPRRVFVAPQRFRERCDFEAEIETTPLLRTALEPLADRCAQFLRERQAGVQALELVLRHRVLPATRVRVGLAGVTSERRRLIGVLYERLDRLELDAPVRSMELKSGPLQPLSADSLDVFGGLRSGVRSGACNGGDTAPQLVERLRARLGEEAVYGVRSRAEHRPEAAWRREHAIASSSARDASIDPVIGRMPRPVWLLDRPAPLAASGEALRREGLILEQGPERIESGWWDGQDVTRDYYVARQRHGARWWVFQERRTRCWFLHGVFA